METTRLGRTNLHVTRTAFGVLPIQRVPKAEAVRILHRAWDAGINFYDTARGYSDSEEKIGAAFAGSRRDRIFIATKTPAATRDGVLSDLETSLRMLQTDHVDILQLHNPGTLPAADAADSAYAGLLEARRQGKIRFLGITSHSLERALAATDSGLYDTVQFPINCLSDAKDLALIERCRAADAGLIAMKPLSGGLLTDARVGFAWFRQHPSVVPIWGVQRMAELEQFLELEAQPPTLDAACNAQIEHDRRTLAGGFCRACGYCLPCPAEIPVPMAARMPLLLRRMPWQQFVQPEWQEKMGRIRACTACGHCRTHCPYGLDAPALLQKALADYDQFCAEHAGDRA